jgi:hypothetical protein
MACCLADAVHDDHPVGDRTVDENGAMRGDAGDTQACREPVADAVGGLDSELGGHHDDLRRRAERPVGLRAVDQHSAPDPPGVDAWTDGVDDARAVAVRHDARVGHRRAQPALAFLMSPGFTPDSASATRTSPAAGLGVANSPTSSTSLAAPCRSYQAARTQQKASRSSAPSPVALDDRGRWRV